MAYTNHNADVSRAKRDRLQALRTLIQEQPSGTKHQLRSDINITPLVDVVLVLLIIFMVVTPLIASGVAVDLPRTANHSRKPDDGRDIIISVTSDKRVYLGARRLTRPEDVRETITNEKRAHPEKTVFLKGDMRAPYGAVKEVMLELHRSDIDDVVLGTEEIGK